MQARYVGLHDLSRWVLDVDDTHGRIRNGSKRLRWEVEGSSAAATVGASIHNLHFDDVVVFAPLTRALYIEELVAVFPGVPNVSAAAVTSCCKDHVGWELVLIVSITGRRCTLTQQSMRGKKFGEYAILDSLSSHPRFQAWSVRYDNSVVTLTFWLLFCREGHECNWMCLDLSTYEHKARCNMTPFHLWWG